MTALNVVLARRFSRRHFVSYVGRLSAVAAGGGLVSLAAAPTALATYCGQNHSVNCRNLRNWNSNACPPETCDNNSVFWIDCDYSLCPAPQHVQWYDCCGGCSSSSAHCKSCNCDSGPASCCYSGSGTWCNPSCYGKANCCRKFICNGLNPTC